VKGRKAAKTQAFLLRSLPGTLFSSLLCVLSFLFCPFCFFLYCDWWFVSYLQDITDSIGHVLWYHRGMTDSARARDHLIFMGLANPEL